MKMRLEIDLECDEISSVADLARALREAADALVRTCGADCTLSSQCRKCWHDLTLTDTEGNSVGTGTLLLE